MALSKTALRKQRQRQRVIDMEIGCCKRKALYLTRDDALAAKGRHTCLGLAEYQCPFCGGWHLTKSENWGMLELPVSKTAKKAARQKARELKLPEWKLELMEEP